MLDDDSIPCSGEQSVEPPSILDLLKVFSIFVFATACQTNVFPILSELEMPTDKRFFSLFTTSVSSASLSYLLFGACSYATYGDSVQSDAIVNYPANKVDSVARIFFSLVVAFSYPLQANPARRSAMSVLHVLFDGDEEPSLKSIRIRYFLVTAAFLSLSLALGLIFEDLGIVLGLVGATGSTTVMFILPGWHYLSLFHWNEGIKAKEGAETLASVGNVGHFQKVPSREPREDTEDELTAKLNQDDPSCNLEYLPVHQKSDVYVYLAWIQLVSGCIIMPVCLIALFL
jgi:hypothetical protein